MEVAVHIRATSHSISESFSNNYLICSLWVVVLFKSYYLLVLHDVHLYIPVNTSLHILEIMIHFYITLVLRIVSTLLLAVSYPNLYITPSFQNYSVLSKIFFCETSSCQNCTQLQQKSISHIDQNLSAYPLRAYGISICFAILVGNSQPSFLQ